MIVVFGLIATQLERVNWSGLARSVQYRRRRFLHIFGETYNFDDHLEQSLSHRSQPQDHRHSRRGQRPRFRRQQDHRRGPQARRGRKSGRRRQIQQRNQAHHHRHRRTGHAQRQGRRLQATTPSKPISIFPCRAKFQSPSTSRRGDVNLVGREGNVDIAAQHSDTIGRRRDRQRES